VLYHPSHFEAQLTDKDTFYYNHNVWRIRASDGQALFYYAKHTSQVCGYRDIFVEHYKNRVKKVEAEGFKRSMGFEPGTHKPPRGFDHFKSDVYMSKRPNIDIRHSNNLTANRFKKSQFRDKSNLDVFELKDSVPGWGRTKGCFNEFLKDISDRLAKHGI
jgi:hypothetical protein